MALLLLGQQLDLQLIDNGVRDLVLDGEDIGEIAVVAIGPQMPPVAAVDELRGDAHP